MSVFQVTVDFVLHTWDTGVSATLCKCKPKVSAGEAVCTTLADNLQTRLEFVRDKVNGMVEMEN